MKIMQLNLNHCAAAQDLLLESVRENGVDADGGFVRALVGSVWVYSVYLAPSLPISDFANTLDRLAADVRDHSPVFVAGDFNAWAVDWGSMVTNQRGRLLVEAFASLDLTLHNQGSQWTFSRAGTGSIVDLTFCSSSLAHSAEWELVERAGSFRQRRANGRNCHGEAGVGLRRLYAESSKPLVTPHASLLVERDYCRRKTCLQPREEALSESTGKTLFPRMANTLWRESRKTLKNAIRESKKRCFLSLCDTLDDDPWGKAYQIVIRRIGTRKSPPSPDDILRGNVTDLFPSVEEDNAWLPNTASNDYLPLKLVTSEKVLKCVRSMKQTGAPGPDGIPARALMLACSLHPEAFSSMLNKCLEEAIVPDRPICLIDVAGKLLEKVICTRLEEAILVNGNLSPNQYGFRKARSTVDAIEKVVGIASNAIGGTRWKGGQKKYCLMVTLDIRNAFNSAR
ncbi:uncharacterized protein LOC133835714 [Drosophila sulfurigaster albostrigata]|uniref:uncharacterized protein LOC133835714 n=1 Tax=Drosophila sulfurigaster albostrigata TaxID=89887 RepID=UPI002D21C4A1|nr:uncharacterized protein LOC133835714 [Drosophila sulfurigaster albostrigata]